MNIEIRSPIKFNPSTTTKLESLVDAARRVTEKEMKPRVSLLNRVRRRMASGLNEAAYVILDKEAHERGSK